MLDRPARPAYASANVQPACPPLTRYISRAEQRVLHLLAQGGHIAPEHAERRITDVRAFTRDGWLMPGLDLALFRRLKRRRAIASRDGGPCRITRRGLALVRGQPDNN
jgi:uncharacterized protein